MLLAPLAAWLAGGCGAPGDRSATPGAAPATASPAGAPGPGAAPLAAEPELTGDFTLVVQDGHRDAIEYLVHSPDGAALVSGDRDGEVRLWDARTGELRGLLGKLRWPVKAIAYRSDGARVAAADSGSTPIVAFDPHTGARAGVHAQPALLGNHEALFYGPGGLWAGSSSNNATLNLWPADPPGKARVLEGPARSFRVAAAAASPDGRLLAVCNTDEKELRLYKTESGAAVGQLEGTSGSGPSVAFSRSGRLVARGAYGDAVMVWDVGSGKVAATLPEKSFEMVNAMSWGPEDRFLAYGRGAAVLVLAVPGGEELARIPVPGLRVEAVSVAPDGETLAAGGWEPEIRIHRVSRDTHPIAVGGGPGRIRRFVWAPRGKAFALGTAAGPSLICRIEGDRRSCIRLEATGGRTESLAFTADGSRLGGWYGPEVAVHDAGTGRALARAPTQGFSAPGSVTLSADGGRLLLAGRTHALKALEVGSGTFEALPPNAYHAAVSPDGSRIALGKHGGSVLIVEAGSLRTVKELKSPLEDGEPPVAWSPDGSRLAAAFEGGILVWSVGSGAIEKSMLLRDRTVAALAFAPDGATLASGTLEGEVALWDLSKGKLLRDLPGLSPLSVRALSFDPTGAFLAASGGGARLYRLSDGASLRLEGFTWGERDTLLAYTDEGWVDGDEAALGGVRYRAAGDWVRAPLVPLARVRSRFHRPGMLSRFLAGGEL